MSDTKYVLSSFSIKARNFLMLHAANMAIDIGYVGFRKKHCKAGLWCIGGRNGVGQYTVSEGGPSTTALIFFVKINEQKNKMKIYVAEEIINKLSDKVNHIITSEEASTNQKAMIQHCWENRY